MIGPSSFSSHHCRQGDTVYIFFDAYQEAIEDASVKQDSTYLLDEVIVKKFPALMSQVTFRMKTAIHFCTAAFVKEDKVYMLARAPGTSYC